MRYPQSLGHKGSLKWIQHAVNESTDHLNEHLSQAFGIAGNSIDWLSPLKTDDYAEYRDQAFLELLDTTPLKRPLSDFWPNKGPQWDALARAHNNKVILVEAKAHLPELISPKCGASLHSLKRIQQSMRETQAFLNISERYSWTQEYYQLANRIAHLYFLRVVNQIDAYLTFIYFTNDREMHGPRNQSEWAPGIEKAHQALGITSQIKLAPFIKDIFISVDELDRV